MKSLILLFVVCTPLGVNVFVTLATQEHVDCQFPEAHVAFPSVDLERSCSTVASERHGRAGDLAWRTGRPVSTKFSCHEQLVGLLGGS
jgi:hypothetical protein